MILCTGAHHGDDDSYDCDYLALRVGSCEVHVEEEGLPHLVDVADGHRGEVNLPQGNKILMFREGRVGIPFP